jgi:cytochrome c oxidase subunit III
VVCHHRRVAEGVTLEQPARRPSLLAVGTVVWLASELMFFGGLFAAYFTLRANAAVWPPLGTHLETVAAALATVVLISSSVTLHFAGSARNHGDRTTMHRWMVITIALGAVFFANQVREFFVLDFSPSSNSYGSMYYVMTGFHAAHVFAGLLLIITAIAITTGGASLERRAPACESVEYFWHFVDLVWIFLFFTLFVLR